MTALLMFGGFALLLIFGVPIEEIVQRTESA